MRKYSMEYYMMNDTTFYCPEWMSPEVAEDCRYVEEAEGMSRIGKLFKELFG